MKKLFLGALIISAIFMTSGCKSFFSNTLYIFNHSDQMVYIEDIYEEDGDVLHLGYKVLSPSEFMEIEDLDYETYTVVYTVGKSRTDTRFKDIYMSSDREFYITDEEYHDYVK